MTRICLLLVALGCTRIDQQDVSIPRAGLVGSEIWLQVHDKTWYSRPDIHLTKKNGRHSFSERRTRGHVRLTKSGCTLTSQKATPASSRWLREYEVPSSFEDTALSQPTASGYRVGLQRQHGRLILAADSDTHRRRFDVGPRERATVWFPGTDLIRAGQFLVDVATGQRLQLPPLPIKPRVARLGDQLYISTMSGMTQVDDQRFVIVRHIERPLDSVGPLDFDGSRFLFASASRREVHLFSPHAGWQHRKVTCWFGRD